jgi:hypothetical protein
MANLKISQLTTYTGTVADQRWFVMNNQGETATFKFSGYTSPLKNAYSQYSFQNVYDETQKVNGDYQCIVGGFNNEIQNTDPRECIIGGYDNLITTKSQGYGSVIVGGAQNIIGGPSVGTANFSAGIYTSQACENNGYWTGMLGAIRAKIYNTNTDFSNIIGGDGNIINNGGKWSNIFGGFQNTLSSTQSAIIGGNNNTSTGSNQIMLGTVSRTASMNNGTFVENLVVFNYASLNFADDTAAAAGGVVLGQVYHNAGALRIRIV